MSRAIARVLTIQVALDAEIACINTCVAPPTIEDIRETLMHNAPFEDYVISVELMADQQRPMSADEFGVAISTEGKVNNEQN